jgi:hypothetical protein
MPCLSSSSGRPIAPGWRFGFERLQPNNVQEGHPDDALKKALLVLGRPPDRRDGSRDHDMIRMPHLIGGTFGQDQTKGNEWSGTHALQKIISGHGCCPLVAGTSFIVRVRDETARLKGRHQPIMARVGPAES